MYAWLALILVALNAFAALEPPIPAPPVETQQQQGIASNPQQGADTNQRGTDDKPVVIKILTSEEDAQKAAAKEEREIHQSTATDVYVGTNIFVACFTFAIAIFTILLWCSGRDTARRQLRAYVGLQRIELDTPNLADQNYRLVPDAQGSIVFNDFVRLHLYNYGQTPASNVTTVIGVATVRPLFSPLPPDFAYRTDLPPSGPQIAAFRDQLFLEPRETAISYVSIRDEIMEQLRTSEAKTCYLYFYGEIEYDDIYGRRWRHMFCRGYEPWRAEGHRFMSYKEHNGEEEVRK